MLLNMLDRPAMIRVRRTLEEQDIQFAHDIQCEWLATMEQMQRNRTLSQTGCLVSHHTLADLKQRASRGALFLAKNDEPLGYLIADTGAQFSEDLRLSKVLPESKYKDLVEELVRSAGYIYLDQIGVSKAAVGRGIGRKLVEAFEAHFSKNRLVVSTLLKPIPNHKSYRFFTNAGYVLIGTADFPHAGNFGPCSGTLLYKG